MGEGGADVKLSPKAKNVFPFDIECKYQEKYKGLYNTMAQAEAHGFNRPLVFIKMNRRDPLVLMRAETFWGLINHE